MHVPVHVVEGLFGARRGIKKDRGVDLDQLDLEAHLLPALLDHRLRVLPDGADRSRITDFELDPVFLAGAAVSYPAGLVQELIALLDVELPGGIGRGRARDAEQNIGRRRLAWRSEVKVLGDRLAVYPKGEGLPHRLVAEDRVGRLPLRLLPIDLFSRIGEIERDELDGRAGDDHEIALAVFG